MKSWCIFFALLTFAIFIAVALLWEVSIAVGFISISIAFVSVSLGLSSLKLGNESKQIAEHSDEKVNSIANANFRRVIGQIEDRRLDLKGSDMVIVNNTITPTVRIYTAREINTWKCLTYIDEAFDILENCNIKSGNIRRFLNLVNSYVEQVTFVKKYFTVEEVTHILSMYKQIFSLDNMLEDKILDECKYDERKTESIGFIRDITGVDVGLTINLDFVSDYKNIISNLTEQDDIKIRWLPFNKIHEIIHLQYTQREVK